MPSKFVSRSLLQVVTRGGRGSIDGCGALPGGRTGGGGGSTGCGALRGSTGGDGGNIGSCEAHGEGNACGSDCDGSNEGKSSTSSFGRASFSTTSFPC